MVGHFYSGSVAFPGMHRQHLSIRTMRMKTVLLAQLSQQLTCRGVAWKESSTSTRMMGKDCSY